MTKGYVEGEGEGEVSFSLVVIAFIVILYIIFMQNRQQIVYVINAETMYENKLLIIEQLYYIPIAFYCYNTKKRSFLQIKVFFNANNFNENQRKSLANHAI